MHFSLLWTIVKMNRKALSKNKLLGQLWTFLDPLMLMGVYTVLVVFIFKRNEPQFPVLLFCCILSWRWFSTSLSQTTTILKDNQKILTSVTFPRKILPLSCILDGFIDYLAGLLILIPLLIVFNASFSFNMLWLPILLAIQLMLTTGLVFICATIGAYYTDLRNILQFTLRLWFYLSPALYSITLIPDRYKTTYMILNPFASLFESYKNVLVRGQGVSDYLLAPVFIGLTALILGVNYFNRKEYSLIKGL